MARPRLKIDETLVFNYARLGASNREIADMLGCDEGTIRGRFSAELTKARASRKLSLRRWQWKAAKAGNTTMQIWLGKNELGQSDKTVIEHTGENGEPIQVNHTFDNDRFSDLYRRRTGRNPASAGSASPNGN